MKGLIVYAVDISKQWIVSVICSGYISYSRKRFTADVIEKRVIFNYLERNTFTLLLSMLLMFTSAYSARFSCVGFWVVLIFLISFPIYSKLIYVIMYGSYTLSNCKETLVGV